MATATAVTIKVVVDGSQAGPAIEQINQGLGEIGVKGTASIQQAGRAMDDLSGHVARPLDGVRLLSQEFGLRMPRALEAMASRVPMIVSGINMAMGALAATAIIEIFARVGEAMYRAFDLGGERARAIQTDVNDVTISMRRMNDETQVQIDKLQEEHAKFEQKPFNGMKLALDEASLAADQFAEKMGAIDEKIRKAVADMGNKGGFSGAVSWLFTGDASTAYEQTMLQQHEKWMALATSPEKQGDEINRYIESLQRRKAELNDPKFLAHYSPNTDFTNERNATDLQLQFANKEKSQHQADVDLSNAQQQKELDVQHKAAADDAAKRAKEAAEQQLDILRAQHEAILANMSGQDLAAQKLIFDTEELKKKLELDGKAAEIPAEVQALNAKYFAEMSEKTIELQNKTAEAVRRSQIEAMPDGPAKIDAEHWQKVQENNTTLTGDDRSSANAAAAEEAQKKLDAYNQSAAEKELERQARINQLETSYAQQAADAQRRIKEEGLVGWVDDYKAAIAAIQAQREADTQKLEKERLDLKMQDQEYGQAKASIDARANAEIQQQNQEMAHQIANTLQSAFDNPVEFIKRRMQQMFMEIIADAIMRLKIFQELFGQTMGNVQPGGAAAGGGILGGIGASVRGTFGAHPAAAGASAGVGGGSGGAVSIGAAIPNSGGMVMTAAGPAPALQGASGSSSSTAESMTSVATGIPGLYRRVSTASQQMQGPQASLANVSGANPYDVDTSGAGIPSISGDGSLSPGTDDDLPNIANGLPGAGPNQTGIGGGIQPSGGTGGMATAATAIGDAATIGVGGYEGYEDTKADFKSGTVGGMLKGTLGDAMAGAAIGSLFGPAGTVIGAAAGAAVGLIAGATGIIMGEGGRLAARDYYKKTLFPEIEKDRLGEGSSDWQTAVNEVNRTSSDGMSYMSQHWGVSAANWVYANYLQKEQKLALSEIESRAKGGSAAVSMTANQFHGGGPIDGFGDFGTGGSEGLIHALMGETVMNQRASIQHGTILNAMNAGASASDVAKMYLGSGNQSSSTMMTPAATTHQWTVHAVDAQSFEGLLKNGGARAVVKHINRFASQYAGDGISG